VYEDVATGASGSRLGFKAFESLCTVIYLVAGKIITLVSIAKIIVFSFYPRGRGDFLTYRVDLLIDLARAMRGAVSSQ
jgi:hypothetical protein